PAWKVEGTANAEPDAGLHFAHALEDLLGGDEVDPTELVVIAEVAPRRALGTLCPSLRHGHLLSAADRVVPTGWSTISGVLSPVGGRQEGPRHDRQRLRGLRGRARP